MSAHGIDERMINVRYYCCYYYYYYCYYYCCCCCCCCYYYYYYYYKHIRHKIEALSFTSDDAFKE